MDRIEKVFEVRAIDDKPGAFTGYASVFDVVDSYGTVFDKGAFKKTLKEHKGQLPIVWMHDVYSPIGLARVKEDDKGLWVEGQLDLDVEKGRDVYSGMQKGYITEMSHSFASVKSATTSEEGEDILHYKEVRSFEVSPTTTNFASNSEAQIVSVRSTLSESLDEIEAVVSKLRGAVEVRGATPYANLSLADKDRSWDAGEARARVKDWADGDMKKYRRAFLWYDPDNEDNLTAYKFPIADVIDGSLKAVPRGIYAAAARIDGSDVDDKDGVKASIAKYYKKMGEEAPWERMITEPALRGAEEQIERMKALLEPSIDTRTEPRVQPGDHWATFNAELIRVQKLLGL